jgi:hypothetical protein
LFYSSEFVFAGRNKALEVFLGLKNVLASFCINTACPEWRGKRADEYLYSSGNLQKPDLTGLQCPPDRTGRYIIQLLHIPFVGSQFNT